jgi:hypothetical protein
VALTDVDADPFELTNSVSATGFNVIEASTSALAVADAPEMLVVPGGGEALSENEPKPAGALLLTLNELKSLGGKPVTCPATDANPFWLTNVIVACDSGAAIAAITTQTAAIAQKDWTERPAGRIANGRLQHRISFMSHAQQFVDDDERSKPSRVRVRRQEQLPSRGGR